MDRRRFLKRVAAAGVAAIVPRALADKTAPLFAPAILAPMEQLGAPLSPISQRAASEQGVVRYISDTLPSRHTGASFAPLEHLTGTLTPSDLHFERHHAGVPYVDPDKYRLLIHGMVHTPTMFTLADLKRYPSQTSMMFIECAGNGQTGFQAQPDPTLTATRARGLVSNSEWAGTPLRLILEQIGVAEGALWLLAEGMDGTAYTRSVPLAKALESCFLAYGQNGEALRPQQGFPVRLMVPGWEGSMHVKWLRRLELSDTPYMTRDETSTYTDPNPDGTSSVFTWPMLAQSIITFPSGQQTISRGFIEIRGLAWSGAGAVVKVEVSTDQGKTWHVAQVQEASGCSSMVRFTLPWRWDGTETVVMSRATDESGYTQPPRAQVLAMWGLYHRYHYNGIQAWRITASGAVINGDEPYVD